VSKKCPQCNSENADSASFCSDCGTQIGTPKNIPDVTQTLETPFPQLNPGAFLAGRYQIIGEIGKGGMGEVYLAEDTNLKRQVAIKVLPQQFAQDKEWLARFEREARLLASLNHPNIATVHGLEKSNGQQFLVMELVEGDTLADRIKNGPLDTGEALELCLLIAEGLESAHEKGIIHRDLKPANVKVTPDGKVKILDFGLAKAFLGQSGDSDLSKSPAISDDMTRPGVILGTAAYMSPEQAKGKPLDKKTDIWAFGCILYESLTGNRAFKGETISEILASILKDEPDWSVFPDSVSPKAKELVRRCLVKNPRNRRHDIAEARIDLQDILTGPPEEIAPTAQPSSEWRILFWAVSGFALILFCLMLWSPWRTSKPSEQRISRFAINLPPNETLSYEVGPSAALSPDGTQLVYVAQKEETTQLYLRLIQDFDAQPISDTEGAKGPFFSPDGTWVAFHADGKLKKISLLGGTPQIICDAKSGLGGTWSEDDTIYFGDWYKASIMCVSADGGVAERLTTGLKIDSEGTFEHSHFWPQILPGGKAFLFTVWNNQEDMFISLYSLETGEKKTLIERGSHARYLPSGQLIYSWAGDLIAVPFDLEKLEVTGSPVPVIEGVMANRLGLAHFSVSENGSLVFVPGPTITEENRLAWVDLKGDVEYLPFPIGNYQSPRLSPDGKQLVASRVQADASVWIYGLERGTSRRLTDEKGEEFWAIWAPDGKHIVFNSSSSGGPIAVLYRKPTDGRSPAESITEGEYHQQPQSWSTDGKFLVLTEGMSPTTGADIWILTFEGDRKPKPFLRSRFNEIHPIFSPDGRWIAYATDESGREEVYVRPYPGPGDIITISTEGGMEPVWGSDGEVLYYRDNSGDRMMAVSFITEPEVRVSKPQLLFEGRYKGGWPWGRNYDIAPDGKRFIMITDEELKTKPTRIRVVLNWSEELRRSLPEGN
jgi:serine/threonine-protein kinase